MTQLGRDHAEGALQDRRAEAGGQRRAPPSTPYDGEPDRPVVQGDGPNGPVRFGREIDDARNPDDDQERKDVDAAGFRRSMSASASFDSKTEWTYTQRTM